MAIIIGLLVLRMGRVVLVLCLATLKMPLSTSIPICQQNLFPTTSLVLFRPCPHDLNSISHADCEALIKGVSNDEILSALNSLADGKTPGSDGFNAEFYTFFWDNLGDDLFHAIRHFMFTACTPKSWGKTFVTLIPKKEHPRKVMDFHPISLCDVCYKVVTKILANHLKHVLDGLISKEQCGFIAG